MNIETELEKNDRIWKAAFLVFCDERDKELSRLNEEVHVLNEKLHQAQTIPEPLGQTYAQLCQKIEEQGEEIDRLKKKLSRPKNIARNKTRSDKKILLTPP